MLPVHDTVSVVPGSQHNLVASSNDVQNYRASRKSLQMPSILRHFPLAGLPSRASELIVFSSTCTRSLPRFRIEAQELAAQTDAPEQWFFEGRVQAYLYPTSAHVFCRAVEIHPVDIMLTLSWPAVYRADSWPQGTATRQSLSRSKASDRLVLVMPFQPHPLETCHANSAASNTIHVSPAHAEYTRPCVVQLPPR